MTCVVRRGLGWLPDLPDFRDYTVEHELVAPLLAKARLAGRRRKAVPKKADLRGWCPPIEDQGGLGSCTAQAGVALVEYFERRAFGRHVDASRLFLYKATRNLMKITGDTGAYLRSTMGAMVLFGVPPEDFWEYDEGRFDEEPPAFCYAFAQSWRTIAYYALDPPGTKPAAVLDRVRTQIAGGIPAMFGFTVYDSIEQAEQTGLIPMPEGREKVQGGHAMVAVGYDDAKKVKNAAKGAKATTGAFLVRNSWSTGWGEEGYGWLPYEYLKSGLADDWWSVLKAEWVDTGEFGL